jgi:glycosyltransferase involved in cell wall biosynthesis
MKVLAVAPNYPYPGHPFSGIFNEKSVYALSKLCDRVQVFSPRPYVPPLLCSLVPRWKAYAGVPEYENRDGISVYRPITPVVPLVAQAFWSDQCVFLWSRRTARQIHQRIRFDAIISFDLVSAGGLAWRMGRDLDIPASGWATGSDVRVPMFSAQARAVIRALKNLDFVFYQSLELLEKAAALLEVPPATLPRDRHLVLPRGIPEPPVLPRTDIRRRVRAEWCIKSDQVVVLYLGRISRQKGILELLEAIRLAVSLDTRIRCVLVGSKPGFDDTTLVERKLDSIPWLRERVLLVPEYRPESVWECFCAADIFAFPSYREGMPNSLLEAMAMGVPAIAFAIPPLLELEAGTGGVALVSPFDCRQFADTIVRLVACPEERSQIATRGKSLVMDRFMVRKNMEEVLRRLSELVRKRNIYQAAVCANHDSSLP